MFGSSCRVWHRLCVGVPIRRPLMARSLMPCYRMLSTDSENGYLRSCSTLDLIRRTLIFRMCTVPWMATALEKTLKWSRKIYLQGIVHSVLRHSIFNIFCGGENIRDFERTGRQLNNDGLFIVADYAAEPEIDQDQVLPKRYFDEVEKNVLVAIDAAKSFNSSLVAVKFSGLFDHAVLKNPAMVEKHLSATNSSGVSGNWIRKWNESYFRFENICKAALQKNVKLTVDAEQSNLQDSIDLIVMEFMRIFNSISNSDTNEPLIANTYQMYRIDGIERLRKHLELSSKFNFHFGCKIVRGAYVELEAELAKSLRRPNVVHETANRTHEQYNHSVDFMIDYVRKASLLAKDQRKFFVMFATHNDHSIDKVRNILPTLGDEIKAIADFSLAQLYGMSDIKSHILASSGLKCYKYVPFGPVGEVVPYLLRRVQENRHVFAHTNTDAAMMTREIKRRIFGRLMN